jgi:hypothetical protein
MPSAILGKENSWSATEPPHVSKAAYTTPQQPKTAANLAGLKLGWTHQPIHQLEGPASKNHTPEDGLQKHVV